MTWILCCGALWIALVVTICLFFHGATSSDFGEQGGVANDNGVVMQEPRAPLFTETVPGHDLTVVAWRGKPHLLRTKGKPRWLTTRRSR